MLHDPFTPETALAPLRNIPATGVLYHYTGWYRVAEILRTRSLRLTATNGSDAMAGKERFPFYLSMARTTQNRFGRGLQAVLVLDREWLRHHGRIEAVDYWGPSFGSRGATETETEDRLYSRRDALPLPKPITKAVREVHLWFDGKSRGTITAKVRRLLLDLKAARVPVFVYSDAKAMALLDTRRALRGADLRALFDLTPEDKPYQRGRRKVEPGLKQLIHAKRMDQLDRAGQYALRKLLYYGGDQTGNMPGWDADVHNNKTDPGFVDVFRRIREAGGTKPFFEALAAKWLAIRGEA